MPRLFVSRALSVEGCTRTYTLVPYTVRSVDTTFVFRSVVFFLGVQSSSTRRVHTRHP